MTPVPLPLRRWVTSEPSVFKMSFPSSLPLEVGRPLDVPMCKTSKHDSEACEPQAWEGGKRRLSWLKKKKISFSTPFHILQGHNLTFFFSLQQAFIQFVQNPESKREFQLCLVAFFSSNDFGCVSQGKKKKIMIRLSKTPHMKGNWHLHWHWKCSTTACDCCDLLFGSFNSNNKKEGRFECVFVSDAHTSKLGTALPAGFERRLWREVPS